MNFSELIKIEGIEPTTMRMRWNRCGNTDFDRHREITNEEIQRYRAKHPEPSLTPAPEATITEPTVSRPKLTPMPAQNNKPIPTQWDRIKDRVGLYDLLMWADITLGTYSLFLIFGPLAGLLVGVKISLFFEAARRIMRRVPAQTEGLSESSHNKAYEHNLRLTRTKQFVMSISVFLSAIFCWANGQNFYRAMVAHTPDLTQTHVGDIAARTFAIAVTAIALSAMYTLNLNAAIKNGK
jgi:hypothetical protein